MTRNQTILLMLVLMTLAAGLRVIDYMWALRETLRRTDVRRKKQAFRRMAA